MLPKCNYREKWKINLTIWNTFSCFNLLLFAISVNLEVPFRHYSEITWPTVDNSVTWSLRLMRNGVHIFILTRVKTMSSRLKWTYTAFHRICTYKSPIQSTHCIKLCTKLYIIGSRHLKYLRRQSIHPASTNILSPFARSQYILRTAIP